MTLIYGETAMPLAAESYSGSRHPPLPSASRSTRSMITKAAVTSRSRDRHRGRLATLLMMMLEEAGLTRIDPGQPLPSIADQYRALRTAAREIELEEDVILASFLCTYLPARAHGQDRAHAARAFPAQSPAARLAGDDGG